MSINKNHLVFCLALIFIFASISCSPQISSNPTPDVGALATQLWVELSVRQTLEASIPTAAPTPTETPTPIAGLIFISTPIPASGDLTNNQTFQNPVDQMALAYVPAGEFIMGSPPTDHDLSEDELPQHTVYLDAFWISTTEVTNEKFNACVNAGVCKYTAGHSTNPHYLDPTYANHPVVYVSWAASQTYCEWTGGRLPTEAEWEKAARGTNGQRYAWGEERPRLKFVNAANEYGVTTDVRAFAYGISPYGVYDMGGNVREWVYDWYDPTYFQNSPDRNPIGPDSGEKKVLKGASFSDDYRYCRAANRLTHEPQSSGNTRGFRCVYP